MRKKSSRAVAWLCGATLLLLACRDAHTNRDWQNTHTEPSIAFRYDHAHAGAPTLLVVHGGPGDNSAYLMESVGQRWATKYNIIWYDQRGTGKSQRNLSYDMYATTHHVEDIKRVQDAAGISQVILVAHSWGGIPAGLYAARYPDRVRAFVNINGTGSFLDVDRSLLAALKQYYHEQPAILAEIADIERLPHGFLRFIKRAKMARAAGLYYKDFQLTKHAIAVSLQEAVRSGEYTEAEIAESEEALQIPLEFHSLDTVDIYSALTNITSPTLVTAGTYDKVVDVDSARRYQSAIPHAELVVFTASGHHPFQEEPEQFDAVMDAFIQKTVQ